MTAPLMYQEAVDSGEMTLEEALVCEHVRVAARQSTHVMLASATLPGIAGFGVLDAAVVALREMYGGDALVEILHRYLSVTKASLE